MTTASFLCDAILFDLDGVLVDSHECVARIVRQWCERHGLDAGHVIATAQGRRPVETVQLVAPSLDAASEAAWLISREATETEGVFPVPGATRLLGGLPPRAWAVVTSGARAAAELRMRHAGLPRPPILICSEDVIFGKPHPEPYLTAARHLKVSPGGCVVIEDAPAGIESARRAGMRTIGVLSTYGAGAVEGADIIATSLASLNIRPVGGRIDVGVVAR